MPIESTNGVGDPALGIGALFESTEPQTYYTPEGSGGPGEAVQVQYPDQIAGLVPVFPCDGWECRQGLFGGDRIRDESLWPLPVFASLTDDLDYHNDINSWLFDVPAISNGSTTYDFFLEKLIGDTWTPIVSLNDNTYGVYFDSESLCDGLKWKGYLLRWKKVLQLQGAGMYRFRISITIFGIVIDPAYPDVPIVACEASPPFCLQEWDCVAANRTVKFETTIQGGRVGSIDKTDCGHKYWDFCCSIPTGLEIPFIKRAITWLDSVRVFGYFGREEKEYERNKIKYSTGQDNLIRSEAVRKFKFRSFGNTAANPGTGYPDWLHDRLSVYAFQDVNLTVSDYNINNPDYNLKQYCVELDGAYVPDRTGSSRYAPVECSFKPRLQYLIKTTCC